MTVHKVKMCGCGHEASWHKPEGKGACVYGHGTTMGGCTCAGFGRRRRPDVPALLETAAPAASSLVDAVNVAIGALIGLRDALAANGGPAMLQVRAFVTEAPAPRRAPRVPKPAATKGDGQLRAGERRILEVVARHHPTRLTRTQLATLAGFSPTGGTYQTYLSTLRRNEFVEEDRAGLLVTNAGIRASGFGAPRPMTRAEILERWRGTLRAGERTMLDMVLEHGPVERAELGRLAGLEPSAGTFGTYLSVLKRNGLVDVDGRTVRVGKALSEAR